jgi:2',3'-cyclic-nucleotide 2'-phosphodiesterase (5'-nucleotidase family)
MFKKLIAIAAAAFLALPLFSQQPIEVDILQINDVYEISPLENGSVGGMARVATLRNQLVARNPNTYSVLPGDFLSPSAMGLTKVNGTRLAGAQMVDVLNRIGFDLVTFGNHEFDLDEASLLNRINESHFTWISGNCVHLPGGDSAKARPFTQRVDGQDLPLAPYHIEEFYGKSHGSFKVGFLAVTIPSTQPKYVRILDPLAEAKRTYELLSKQCDVVVGVTHLTVEEDEEVARQLPGLAFIMGAHEHSRSETKVGNVVIYKPDANAKSAWVHHLSWDPATRKLSLSHKLEVLDKSVAEDPSLNLTVEHWNKLVFDAMKQDGFDPEQVVATLTETLDGREVSNRNGQTNLGQAIAKAMKAAWPDADCGLLNSGSIRIDDQMEGTLTQYDIFRILPFGGGVVRIKMRGEVLTKALDLGTSEAMKGNGGYLQLYGVEKGPKGWLIGGKAIKSTKDYVIAGTEYWITKEAKYLELWKANSALFSFEQGTTPEQKDIRKALITSLSTQSR